MSWQLIGPGGFVQLGYGGLPNPSGPDSQNPAARAYATHMLQMHGIVVPRGMDPTAMWRDYSARLMAARNTASAAGPDVPDYGPAPHAPVPAGSGPRANPQAPNVDNARMALLQLLAARMRS